MQPIDMNAAAMHPHPGVRAALAKRADRLPESIVHRLLNDVDSDVRVAVARSASQRSLVEAALTSGCPARVREAAATRLGELGDASAGPALVDALADRDALVRAAAVRSLDQLLDPVDITHLLERALLRPDPRYRRAVLHAAARLASHLDVGLLEALAGDDDADVRLALAEVANVVCTDPRALLAALERDRDPIVRHSAILHATSPS